jgi:hypothetical protein
VTDTLESTIDAATAVRVRRVNSDATDSGTPWVTA